VWILCTVFRRDGSRAEFSAIGGLEVLGLEFWRVHARFLVLLASALKCFQAEEKWVRVDVFTWLTWWTRGRVQLREVGSAVEAA